MVSEMRRRVLASLGILSAVLLVSSCGERLVSPNGARAHRDVNVEDPSITLTIEGLTYNGQSTSAYPYIAPNWQASNACQNWSVVAIHGADGAQTYFTTPCYFNQPLSHSGVPAGDYQIVFQYQDEQFRQHRDLLTTVTLSPGQMLSVPPIELNTKFGLMASTLKVNGVVPPDYQYSICANSARNYCSYATSQGTFTALVPDGAVS